MFHHLENKIKDHKDFKDHKEISKIIYLKIVIPASLLEKNYNVGEFIFGLFGYLFEIMLTISTWHPQFFGKVSMDRIWSATKIVRTQNIQGFEKWTPRTFGKFGIFEPENLTMNQIKPQ